MPGDRELLQAALVGLEHRRSEIKDRMADSRRRLGVRGTSRPSAPLPLESAPASLRKRRRMSAAGLVRGCGSRLSSPFARR
jgi:hypothetical protein